MSFPRREPQFFPAESVDHHDFIGRGIDEHGRGGAELLGEAAVNRAQGVLVIRIVEYSPDVGEHAARGVEGGQQIIRVDPAAVAEGYVPDSFVTGLIRPIDVALAPDGALVIADYIYGHVWRVVYEGAD